MNFQPNWHPSTMSTIPIYTTPHEGTPMVAVSYGYNAPSMQGPGTMPYVSQGPGPMPYASQGSGTMPYASNLPATSGSKTRAVSEMVFQTPSDHKPAVSISSEPSESSATPSTESLKKQEAASLGKLFRFATAWDWLVMLVAAICSAFVGAAQPGMVILFTDLMNLAGETTAGGFVLQDEFNQVAIQMAALGAMCFAAAWIGDSGFRTSGLRQSAMWRKHYLKAILSQDIGWYDTNNPSELSSRIADLTQQVEEGIGPKLSTLFRAIGQGVFGLGISFWYSWDVALVLVAVSPIVMFATWFLNKTTTEASGDMATAYAKAGGTASETISELRTVNALNAEEKQAAKFSQNLEDARLADVRKAARVGFANGLLFSSGNILVGVGFIYGAFKMSKQLKDTAKMITMDGVEYESNCADYTAVDAGQMESCGISGGDVIIALFSLQLGAEGLGVIEPSFTAFTKARTAVATILKVVDRVLTINAFSEEGEKPSSVQGKISFHDVHFAYPSRPDQKVANGYSLTVEAGTTVALVGASGSGKSTAVQLIERFYDPDSGVVQLDGRDLKTLNVHWLRQQIGMVGQEPVLFSGTIADNIANGKDGATREEVIAAAKMANAHDFILTFPEGYETDVGEKGGQLSGGQKQRIAIARAMIKNPSILLLDEATSALDNESERVVQAALDDLLQKQRRTTIVIAHRLSTIRNADKIVVVEKGTIVEQGTYNQLMARAGGYFYALNAKQEQRAPSGAQNAMAPRGAGTGIGRVPSVGRVPSASSSVERIKSVEEEKEEKKAEAEAEKKVMSRIWKLHSGDSLHFLIGSIGALMVGVAHPANGIVFTKSMFSFYLSDPDKVEEEGFLWGGCLIGIAIIQVVGDTLRGWGFGVPGAKVTKKIRELYFGALIHQEIGWHDLPENASGTLCAGLATEVNLVQALTGETMGRNVLTICTVIGAFGISFWFGSWSITLVAVATIPLMVSGMAIELAMVAGKNTEGGSMGAAAGRIVGEVVTSIRTISSFTLEVLYVKKFFESIDAHLKASFRKAIANGIFPGYSQFALFGAFALLFWYGGKQLAEGKADFEEMFIPIFCMFMLGAGLGQATNNATDAGKATVAARRVFSVIDRENTIDSAGQTGDKPRSVQGKISFHDVHFAYPSRPDQKVANGYSLTVEAGTTVALVGASGSGKSTAVQLIERFYDPDSGVVQLDGRDLKTLNVHWLRQQIGMVGQEPVLFSGTIADNIANGKDGATREEVIAAAKMANAHDFILTFPEGYETDVGEKGGQLSGGQKQRIAIARAMIKNPSILLLDEVTSALDNESERVVQAALDDLLQKQRRTTIVIAHRLSTIRNADKIVVVEKGTIVEQGTYNQLMAKGSAGKFYSLASAQGAH